MDSRENFTMGDFIVCTILRMIKSRRLKWTRHLARMEEGRSAFKILTETLQERDLYKCLGIYTWTIL